MSASDIWTGVAVLGGAIALTAASVAASNIEPNYEEDLARRGFLAIRVFDKETTPWATASVDGCRIFLSTTKERGGWVIDADPTRPATANEARKMKQFTKCFKHQRFRSSLAKSYAS